MPCDARITTNLTNAEHLGAALDALGYEIEVRGETIIGTREGRSITFSKGYGGAYTVARGIQGLTEITVEYSKIGVKSWAKSRGYAIAESEGNRMVLVNRRTY
jgi:hypothetical protein